MFDPCVMIFMLLHPHSYIDPYSFIYFFAKFSEDIVYIANKSLRRGCLFIYSHSIVIIIWLQLLYYITSFSKTYISTGSFLSAGRASTASLTTAAVLIPLYCSLTAATFAARASTSSLASTPTAARRTTRSVDKSHLVTSSLCYILPKKTFYWHGNQSFNDSYWAAIFRSAYCRLAAQEFAAFAEACFNLS